MPLNDPLYRHLLRADPGCEVVSEGEPAEYYLPSKAAGYSRKGIVYASVNRWGECYRLNCPCCGDTGRHLYVCHLAGARVRSKKHTGILSFGSSLCVCHRRHCNSDDPSFRDWLRGLDLHSLPVLDLSKGGIEFSNLQYGMCADLSARMPDPTYPLLSESTPQRVLDWLADDRRHDPYILQSRYGVGFCPAGAVFEHAAATDPEKRFRRMFDDRVVIPLIQGCCLVGWQARLAKRDLDPGDIKFYNSPGIMKSRILYNLDNAMQYDTVVLVEGVFDAWRVGDNAVAMFGKSLSPMQMLQLKTVYGLNGGCIIMLDANSPKETDVNDKARAMAERLRAANVFPRGVVPVCLEDGLDPDRRSRAELDDLIGRASAQLAPPIRGKAPKGSLEELTMGFDELDDGEDGE